MKLIHIDNKDRLNGFALGGKHSRFLQSWEWGEFQKKYSRKIYRLGVEVNGRLAAAGTLFKKGLFGRFGYFYCPRGPAVKPGADGRKIMEFLFNEISVLARDERAIFLRLEPDRKFCASDYKWPFKKTIDIQPAKTLLLDLNRPETELLGSMRQKTRYNIRLAEKKGVAAGPGKAEDFPPFWALMRETAKRDGFRLHPEGYYREMLAAGFIELFVAQFKGKMIAGNLISFFGDTAAYMHGATGNQHRNVMAPYLLQWEAIKLAARRGLRYYDFYGIDETRWPGVTRFKRGFGGREYDYPGAFDLVFDKKMYKFYQLARRLRRIF